jgi:predicted NUDIX family phosphoesterase
VGELVLVLPRASVPDGCGFHGVRPADAAYLARLRDAAARHGLYLERAVAETDPGFKQLIPYVVVRRAGDVFLMRRTDAGGDARLHGRASIGVGGHLNPVDQGEDAVLAGLRREWDEEVDAPWEPEFRLVGLLNDDSNPVGTVHLGVVFTVEAGDADVRVRESDKLAGSFASAEDVMAAWDRLETWSRLVASSLLGIREPV